MFFTDKKVTAFQRQEKCTNGKMYGCLRTRRNKTVSLCQANMGTAVFTRIYLIRFKYISNAYILVQLFCKKKHQESFDLWLADIYPVHLLIHVATVETAAMNDASVYLLWRCGTRTRPSTHFHKLRRNSVLPNRSKERQTKSSCAIRTETERKHPPTPHRRPFVTGSLTCRFQRLSVTSDRVAAFKWGVHASAWLHKVSHWYVDTSRDAGSAHRTFIRNKNEED